MSKPALDEQAIELNVLSERLHHNLTHLHARHIDFPIRDEQYRQIESDKLRYRQLTGHDYVLPQMELPFETKQHEYLD